MPESSSLAAMLFASSLEMKLTPLPTYSYCQPHWKPVTLMSSWELASLPIRTMPCAAGIAIPIRMSTGIVVHTISTLVLWTRVTSAAAPRDLRWKTIDQIITPKTTTPIATQTQNAIMWMLYTSLLMLVTPTGRLRRPQPEERALSASSALAGEAAPAAASSAAMLSHIPGRIPSLARYIVVVPFSRGPLW